MNKNSVSQKNLFGENDDDDNQSETENQQQYPKRTFHRSIQQDNQDEDYQYDELYDSIKLRKQRQQLMNRDNNEGSTSSSKYIKSLIESKQTRELDKLKQQEFVIQAERELESDELKSKESYVTKSYSEYKLKINEQLNVLRKKDGRESGGHQTGNLHSKLLNDLTGTGAAANYDSDGSNTQPSNQHEDRNNENIVTESPQLQELKGGLNIRTKPQKQESTSRQRANNRHPYTNTVHSTSVNSNDNDNDKNKNHDDYDVKMKRRLEKLIATKVTADELSAFKERYLKRKETLTL